MSAFHILTYGMIGLGLSASCGFRVFVPMLFMSCAVHADILTLAAGWEWIGSWPAVLIFGAATLFEVGGYFIPWFDHLLDTVATPAAVVAGALATTACVSELDPALRWSIGIIVGGGAAAVVQTGTVLARGTSTATTGGLGNFAVAGVELVLSIVNSLIAIFLPVLAFLIFLAFSALTLWLFIRWRRKKRATAAPAVT